MAKQLYLEATSLHAGAGEQSKASWAHFAFHYLRKCTYWAVNVTYFLPR